MPDNAMIPVGVNVEEYFRLAALNLQQGITARNEDNLKIETAAFASNEENRQKAAGVNAVWPPYVCRLTKLALEYDKSGFPRVIDTGDPIFIAPPPKSTAVDQLNPALQGIKVELSADGRFYRVKHPTPFGYQTTAWMPLPGA